MRTELLVCVTAEYSATRMLISRAGVVALIASSAALDVVAADEVPVGWRRRFCNLLMNSLDG